MNKELVAKDVIDGLKADLRKNDAGLFIKSFEDESKKEELIDQMHSLAPEIMSDPEMKEYVIQEIMGLGLIERIKKDKGVTDIGFNGTDLIVEANNRPKERYDISDIPTDYFDRLIQSFATDEDKEFNSNHPILSAAVDDIRLSAVHPHNAHYGPTLSMRVLSKRLVIDDNAFVEIASKQVSDLLKSLIKVGCSTLIAGPTGTGKTELQKYLTSPIPFEERIISIEEEMETFMKELYPEKDIYSWRTRENLTQSDLIKAAMRNHAVWIMPTELLGSEAYEAVEATITGHHVISSLHASSTKTIPRRMFYMAGQGRNINESTFLQDFFDGFQIGIHVTKIFINGIPFRYIDEIAEYTPKQEINILFKKNVLHNGSERIEYGRISSDLELKLSDAGIKIPSCFVDTIEEKVL
ncbi:ATPase, T2SS/T4P/T4SS family [Bacillus pumilus]|uniref:ATPase, T2SS/T4P/T4SS family n=1 Tax=Bacillus pumilus TaxID=1408 RepID=UPI0021115781|nr:ATPase, T2SS/T4P/T4SS family [Bacillus pumilus]UUD44647.1 CpaF/VirB11 family protein [Bacillus pumilus]